MRCAHPIVVIIRLSREKKRTERPKSVTMGCIMSICESTPDVPANIIADPEVRTTTT
jgi:hypothetical protein